MQDKPNLVIILSGKRKSGKDFVAELIEKRYGERIAVVHISAPIKQKYAELHGANFEELMKASEYKEKFRLDMVKWSEKEKIDRNDQAYFLKLACQMIETKEKKIWLIADARRLADVNYFNDSQFVSTKIIRVRIQASPQTRQARGWEFTCNIDDAETECGLDDFTGWDYVIDNDGSQEELMEKLAPIFKAIENSS